MEPNREVKIKIADSSQWMPNLISSINVKLDRLPADSYTVCIYKVSEKRRKANEEAYTPRLVSIGPLHHGNPQLQAMEAYKLRCLHNFLLRFSVDLSELVEFAASMESNIHGFYDDTIKLKTKALAEMILLDGIFIIELFLKNYFVQMREESDVIFNNRWMANDLLHDMLLLENQIPLHIPCRLFKEFVDASFTRHLGFYGMSFYELAREYFKDVVNTKKFPITDDCYKARHLVEFLRYLHKPSTQKDEQLSKERDDLLPKRDENTRSATELQEAGVQFKVVAGAGCLFDVSFDKKKGELLIPNLKVNDMTETFFRNLIAFEQCGHYAKNITSYVILMDNLIDTAQDVELLKGKGIIDNELGENDQVANLFNTLYNEIMSNPSDFYFAHLCRDLEAYRKDYWHEWKAKWLKWKGMLSRDYFGNPWSLISVIAAIILLVLTVIQTVCSMRQVI